MTASFSPTRPIGRLLVIEGADGTGKTTQLEILSDRLRRAGHDVSTYDFPSKTGTPIGDLIGSFLRGDYGEVAPEFLALAFSTDRMSLRDQLNDDLAAGRTVLCDRYVSSNIAFQSAKLNDVGRRERLEALLKWVEYDVMRLPLPNLQIALTAGESYFARGEHLQRSVHKSREYIDKADIHEERTDLQVSVNEYYSKLQISPSMRLIQIEVGGERLSKDSLADLIWSTVESGRLLEATTTYTPLLKREGKII